MGRLKIIKSWYLDRTAKRSDRGSRYNAVNRILDSENNEYIASSDNFKFSVRNDDTYHEVILGEENRLDLISFHYYSTPLLWWVIAEASNIIDPFDVPVGTILRIPSKQSIYVDKGVEY